MFGLKKENKILRKWIDDYEAENISLKKEVKEQGEKIIVLDTESKGRQKTTVLVFSVITIVIGTISVCVAIFK